MSQANLEWETTGTRTSTAPPGPGASLRARIAGENARARSRPLRPTLRGLVYGVAAGIIAAILWAPPLLSEPAPDSGRCRYRRGGGLRPDPARSSDRSPRVRTRCSRSASPIAAGNPSRRWVGSTGVRRMGSAARPLGRRPPGPAHSHRPPRGRVDLPLHRRSERQAALPTAAGARPACWPGRWPCPW